MDIDVSICVSSPLVYSYFTCILFLLFFPATLALSLLNIQSSYSFLSSFLFPHPPLPSFLPSLLASSSLSHLSSFVFPFPQLSSALMFDAVHVVVGAVRELNRSQEIGVKPLSCTSPQIWQHGTSLMNYLRMVKLNKPTCVQYSAITCYLHAS